MTASFFATPRRPRVVIVGGGFGGLSAAKALAKTDADVVLIDKRNHHLFQPLLYQVETAALAPNQVANPVRSILRRQRNVEVILDEVINVDRDANEVILRDRSLAFDYLILATGARHDYFGNAAWEAHAPGLKTLDDADAIRQKILLAFERAEAAAPGPARDRALTFVIIGGGPTGVELAGAIAELAGRALACDFRHTRCSDPKVILVESGPRLLSAFSEKTSAYVKRALERRGVDVRLGRPVTECGDRAVEIGDEIVPTDTTIWAAGVKASAAAGWIGAETDRAGRARVNAQLSLDAARNIFVIGDTALAIGPDGKPTPGLAPAAKQMGTYVGRLIRDRINGEIESESFRYRDYGALATIGRHAAVAEFGRFRLTGFPAWVFWSAAHIWFLIGFRNRILVTLDWLWSYFTLERGARLITGDAPLRARSRPKPLLQAAE